MSETTDAVTAKLNELGITDEKIIEEIKKMGATTVEHLAGLQVTDLTGLGVPVLVARKAVAALAPVSEKPAAEVDVDKELPEDVQPSKNEVTSFAGALGIDPLAMWAFMSGQGGPGMDFASLIAPDVLVKGYNAKLRNMYMMALFQLENQIGVPIIVINSDGSVNRELTVEYIEGLQEGRDPAENDIYFDESGNPHEVIRVGVDAQSIYDADPLMPTKALQKSGMGIGRINWKDVDLEVRQVAYYAATVTHEISPTNDGHLAWLRDNMKPGVKRLVFHGQAPRAISTYNAAVRTGALPMLKVMLSRSPRRQEIMPRRRTKNALDLTGIGPERGREE